MNGQNIFLLKYLEENDQAKCIFSDTIIIFPDDEETLNPWNPEDFIISSCPLMFYAFKNKRKDLDNSLFVGLTFEYLRSIRFADINFYRKWYLLYYVINNYGLINTIRHHSLLLLQYFITLFIPSSILNILKDKRRSHIECENNKK